MKRFPLIFLTLFFITKNYGQTINSIGKIVVEITKAKKAFDNKIEIIPFAGMDSARAYSLNKTLKQNIRINKKTPRGKHIVEVRFIILKDKSWADIVCTKDPGFGLCEEVLKVLKKKSSVKWTPDPMTIVKPLSKSTITEDTFTYKQAIKNIRDIFEEYKTNEESIESTSNKTAMTKSFKSLKNVTNKKDLELLINIWNYYDPTDFACKPEVYTILKRNKVISIEAVKHRIKHKMSWESADLSGTQFKNLLKQLENEL
jgi:hypothetical protein